MRKWLIGLCLCLVVVSTYLIGWAEEGFIYYGIRKFRTTILTKTFSAAQTNYELLPDASGNYVIDKLIWAPKGAGYMFLNDTGTVGDVGWGPINAETDPRTKVINDIALKLRDACGLYVTSNSNNGGYIQIEYHLD